MDVSRLALNRLAGQVTQPNLPNFMPPDATPKTHMATVTAIDPGRNEITVTLNEYGSPTVRVLVLQQGSGFDLPAAGDVVELRQVGQSLEMVGRRSRPAGVVVF